MEYTFKINPVPKVRMTGKSKWSDRARKCLNWQKQIGYTAVLMKVKKFKKSNIGFAQLHFYRFGRECDIDNLQKSFYDGLQYGGVFDNDKQIKALDNVRVFKVDNEDDACIKFIIYKLDDDVQK